jgi:L-ascorbate metabolism protein UlaG (beta-lactamase superfamily)
VQWLRALRDGLSGSGDPVGAAVSVAVTRVMNACVLLEIDGDFVLTDPCFRQPVGIRFAEPFGLGVDELPRLTAILVGHRVPDHWQPRALRHYRHRQSTRVFVPAARMARAARRAGFANAEVLHWGDRRTVGPLTVVCAPGERVAGMRTNVYVVSSHATSVLVATEARRVVPDAQVDVAVLPIDGARLFGRALVMDTGTAVATARRLGAALVPIHFSQRPRPPVLRCPTGPDQLPPNVQVRRPGVRMVVSQPGQSASRWS